MYLRMGKRICLLFDGTWNKRKDRTNVWAMKEAIVSPGQREDPHQPLFYDEGVGTHWYDSIRGGLFGAGLGKNLRQGYDWLCRKHREGDEIWVFGFSRGAYTARSLVGMIRKCGVLAAPSESLVEEAYERIYRDKEVAPDDERAQRFRREHARPVRVRFIGVWDTVGSLGVPGTAFPFSRSYYRWHDTELSKIVDYAYHAVACDEERKDFAPTLWTALKPENREVEQKWFIGAHADVGGGYEDGRLQRFALRWMQQKAQACGLLLHGVADDGGGLHHLKPHDSHAEMAFGLYRMIRDRAPRSFGTGVRETVHDSVWRRWAAHADYRPRPLAGHPDRPG
jgi:uncharacterized protein (DUF2235 family)